jgi:gliding motility-associated-like protein
MGKKSYCGIINIPDFYFNKDVSSCNLNINNGDVLIKFIPNIFTPNADNINDYFSIQIAGYKHIEYFIYNRWGNLIHKGKQELNAGIKTEERLWDGRYKGDEVPAGVYFFLIKATKMNGEADIKKGFVQLLR